MKSSYFKSIAATLLLAATAAAQNPDHSGDSLVKGAYFVREVLMTGSASGAVTAASSVTGVITFDGKGNYTFSGQGTSLASGSKTSLSLSGTYNVASNGIFEMTCLADQTDEDYGGVSAIGPWAFVGSATLGSNITLLVGIPIGSSVSNSSFKGNYTAGAIDFPGANINSVREASFSLSPDGAGNLGNVALSGAAADLGGTALNQTVSGVTYSLSAGGTGSVNFGAVSESELVSGSKTFYISADGNIVLGGSASGYDMLVGIRALSGAASNATATGEYYMGAFEDILGSSSCPTTVQAFYGSVNATGTGVSLFHNEITSLLYFYDYTYDSQYTVSANGTVAVGDIPYSYTYGVSGPNGAQAFIAMGDAVGDQYYSLTLGLAQQSFSGSGVFLAPNGVVNSATFSPITNPIAPNEFVSLVGTGLAGAAVSASSLPLMTTLGNVQVTFNGTPAPLNYVSPTQIVALVPSAISTDNGVYYATIQVLNNNTPSNQATVYVSDTAPGVFANPVATGAAAAQHGNYTVISASNPANVGETVIIYAGGLGAVTPTVPDGAAAPSSPLSSVNDPNLSIDFSGDLAAFPCPSCFAGLTPTATGLYQIDVAIPSGALNPSYVDVGTSDAYTSQATMSITGGTSAAVKADVLKKRLARTKGRSKKSDVTPRVR